jgi:hypothetical protein
VLRGHSLPDAPAPGDADDGPLPFVAWVSDETILGCNLLVSPRLGQGTPHELILVRGAASAAAGLNEGLGRARRPWVVCLHRHVYLPDGCSERFARGFREAEGQFGPVGVAGV